MAEGPGPRGSRRRLVTWAVLGLGLGLGCKARGPETHVILFGANGGGEPLTIRTRETTVGNLLKAQGVPWGDHDVVVPSPDRPLTEGMEVDLGQVEREVNTARKKVVHSLKTVYTDDLGLGEIMDVDPGSDGLGIFTTESYKLNGVVAFEKILATQWVTRPKPALVYEGTSDRDKLYRMPKRYRAARKLKLEATAYYPGPEDTGKYASGFTSTHRRAGYGVAAVDPKMIRLNTPLYIEGYGFAWAADVGGAIKGRHIDLCFDTYEEAVRFGRKEVQVYILR